MPRMVLPDVSGERCMDFVRVVNFILQLTYLVVHFIFVAKVYRHRQPTPMWRFFSWFVLCVWLWVSGRFLETIVYLFFLESNDAYVFAANYQYIGLTLLAASYLMWNLYLTGHDRLASSRLFRTFVLAAPVTICTLVFTNDLHHLFYTKLVMGQPVEHGPAFLPCAAWAFALVFAGLLVAIVDIVRRQDRPLVKLVLFSVSPLLPAAVSITRSAMGIDLVDFTPIALTISLWCLYRLTFTYNFVNIIPAATETVVLQSVHPVWIYDTRLRAYTYANDTAGSRYERAADGIACVFGGRGSIPDAPVLSGQREATVAPDRTFCRLERERIVFAGVYGGRHLKVDAIPLPSGGSVLVTALDLTETEKQLEELESKIDSLERLSRVLDEENRNIDAYLGSLYEATGVQEALEDISRVNAMIETTFAQLEKNLVAAREGGADEARRALMSNLVLAEGCISEIRATVGRLREGQL